MKDYCMFNFDYLFSDHFAQVSNQAKLYYIKLCFYANRGFVANPLSVLDSLGFDKSVFWELVKNDEILTLPDRSEVFITSYFIHNPGLKAKELGFSPFWVYWRGKLRIKQNGVATFKAEGLDIYTSNPDPLANIETPNDVKGFQPNQPNQPEISTKSTKSTYTPPISSIPTNEKDWNTIIDELDKSLKEFQEREKRNDD